MNSMKGIVKNIVIFILVLFVIGSFLSLYSSRSFKKEEKVGIETMVRQIQDEVVKEIIVQGDSLHITLRDDKRELVRKEPTESLSALLKNY